MRVSKPRAPGVDQQAIFEHADAGGERLEGHQGEARLLMGASNHAVMTVALELSNEVPGQAVHPRPGIVRRIGMLAIECGPPNRVIAGTHVVVRDVVAT